MERSNEIKQVSRKELREVGIGRTDLVGHRQVSRKELRVFPLDVFWIPRFLQVSRKELREFSSESIIYALAVTSIQEGIERDTPL